MQYLSTFLKAIFTLTLFLFLSSASIAQDTTYARSLMMQLGSPEFAGRAYVDDGNAIAAAFIAQEFKTDSLAFFGKDYFQNFKIKINTIKDVDYLVIDNDTLIAGKDYYISNASKSLKGKYDLIHIDDSLFVHNTDYLEALLVHSDLSKSILVFHKPNRDARFQFKTKVAGVMFVSDNKLPPWSFSHAQSPVDYAIIDVLADKIKDNSKVISLRFKTKFYSSYPTQNVIAYVEGKLQPDSFIVLGAHYDHMGKMGEDVYFPGGNDNASGTAMLLNFARYFSDTANQPDYSIVFIAFTGEEVGLLGSLYFVQNPLFDLKKIKIMINLDMVGTGSKGIVVVNGSKFEKQFNKMQTINKKHNYLPRVKKRGEACNSDHCPFYMRGVPAFFIYTSGDEYSEYHSPDDRPQDVPLTNYNGLFKLIRDFIED